jgi:hypothetical protein
MKIKFTAFARQIRKFRSLTKKISKLNKTGFFEKLSSEHKSSWFNKFKTAYQSIQFRLSGNIIKKWTVGIAAVLGLSFNANSQATIQFAPPVQNPYSITGLVNNFTPPALDFADIDNDGDMDLFVGGTEEVTQVYCFYYYGTQYCYNRYYDRGRVFFMENTGTSTSPNFAAPVVNPFNLVVDSLSRSVSPQFADLDNDGDLDAFFGTQDAGMTIRYYRNNGTASVPNFGTVQNNPVGINLGGAYGYGFPKVVFSDINADGDLDLFSTKLDYGGSNISYQPNNGTQALASFGTLQTNPFGIIPGGLTYRNGFDLADLDFDGDMDIMAQNFTPFYGGIGFKFFENSGTASAPVFGNPLTNPFNITPTGFNPIDMDFVDIDNDGDMDFFSIENSGNINFYQNVSSRGTLSFASPTLNITEPTGGVFIPVTLSAADSTRTITVNVELLGTGTATAGQDFTFNSPQTVTFPQGSTGPIYINVPINNDILIEPNETINFRLTNQSQGLALGISNLTVTITDDDINSPRLEFNTASLNVNENAGTVSFDVTLANSNGLTTEVTVVPLPANAVLNQDYTYNNTRVIFNNGATTPQTVTLNIIDDLLFESTEQIRLGFFNPSNGAVFGTIDELLISITDNDVQPPTLSFSNATLTVDEQVGTVNVDVQITAANANPTTVNVSISGASTATGGVDFLSALNNTLTFPANSNTTQTLSIPIVDDTDFESQEYIVLNLNNQSNAAILGTNSSIYIYINDNDVSAVASAEMHPDDLFLFPNPASDLLNIEVENFEQKSISLLDLNGRILIQQNINTKSSILNLTELPAGVYFIQLRDEEKGQFLTKKFIKK